MADIVIASPFELPGVMGELADRLGGKPFRDKAIAAFVLSRQVKPHQANCDSYVKFGADRKLPTPTDPLSGLSYHVERGDRREVHRFSDQVQAAFEDMEYQLPDVPEGFWEEDAHTITLALEEGSDDLLFIATRDKRYGLDEDMLLEVPVIGGTPVFVELEDMDPRADMLPTYKADNVLVMELAQVGLVPVRESFGDLDALFADFATRTRPEELTSDIELMINALMPE